MILCRFFFSSRRRHTRCSRDWSSDVCSSDLESSKIVPSLMENWAFGCRVLHWYMRREEIKPMSVDPQVGQTGSPLFQRWMEIGRASCRERGEISGVAVSLKKKKQGEQCTQKI